MTTRTAKGGGLQRRCPACERWLSLDAKNFYSNRAKNPPYSGHCRPCLREHKQASRDRLALIDGGESGRVQLRRIRGWTMPGNCVKVARPTRWGNPYVIGGEYDANQFTPLRSINRQRVNDREHAVELFRRLMDQNRQWSPALFERYIAPLRGKSLACFCRIDLACHADVLLELAAEPPAEPRRGSGIERYREWSTNSSGAQS